MRIISSKFVDQSSLIAVFPSVSSSSRFAQESKILSTERKDFLPRLNASFKALIIVCLNNRGYPFTNT